MKPFYILTAVGSKKSICVQPALIPYMEPTNNGTMLHFDNEVVFVEESISDLYKLFNGDNH